MSLYKRVKKVQIPFPSEIEKEFKLFRRLFTRFSKGDFRNSSAENAALQTIAQWTLDVKCDLCNTPRKKIVWM